MRQGEKEGGRVFSGASLTARVTLDETPSGPTVVTRGPASGRNGVGVTMPTRCLSVRPVVEAGGGEGEERPCQQQPRACAALFEAQSGA